MAWSRCGRCVGTSPASRHWRSCQTNCARRARPRRKWRRGRRGSCGGGSRGRRRRACGGCCGTAAARRRPRRSWRPSRRKVKIHRAGPKFGPTYRPLIGVFGQTAGQACELWADPADFRLGAHGGGRRRAHAGCRGHARRGLAGPAGPAEARARRHGRRRSRRRTRGLARAGLWGAGLAAGGSVITR